MPAGRSTCDAHRVRDTEGLSYEDHLKALMIRGSKCPYGPGCASTTFQLLAAAAPLAGGSLERAWDPKGAGEMLAHWQGPPPERPRRHKFKAKAAADEHPAGAAPVAPLTPAGESSGDESAVAAGRSMQHMHGVSAAAGGGAGSASTALRVNKLSLVIAVDEEHGESAHMRPEVILEPEAPRWCAALAQLRTLRTLRVCSNDPSSLSPSQFGAALQRLPALRALRIECLTTRVPRDPAAVIPHAAMMRVLQAVCALTQLSELALINCFFLGEMMSEVGRDEDWRNAALEEVAELSRITRLTSLTMRGGVQYKLAEEWDDLIHAVQKMTALRELHVRTHRTDEVANAGDEFSNQRFDTAMMLEMCASTELTALRSLCMPGTRLKDDFGGTKLQTVHTRIVHINAPLLARLTVLDLSCTYDGGHPLDTYVPHLLSLLADTPALQSLWLRENALGDEGVCALAEALPHLQRLETLKLGVTDMTHTGICAVLRAIIAARAAGAAGVRDLDIGGRLPGGPDAAEAVAGLLWHCQRLEVLHIVDMFEHLAGPGMRAVAPALEALPGLRWVSLLGRTKLSTAEKASLRNLLRKVRVD